KISIDLRSLTTNTIHVNFVNFEHLQLAWEGSASESNLKYIQKHANEFTKDESGPKKSDAKKGEERKVVIDHLSIKDIQATAHLRGLTGVTIPLSDIEMDHLGENSNKNTFADVIEQILGRMSSDFLGGLSKAPSFIGN